MEGGREGERAPLKRDHKLGERAAGADGEENLELLRTEADHVALGLRYDAEEGLLVGIERQHIAVLGDLPRALGRQRDRVELQRRDAFGQRDRVAERVVAVRPPDQIGHQRLNVVTARALAPADPAVAEEEATALLPRASVECPRMSGL